MSYDEHETNSSRVVVETPMARREITQAEREYLPERNGTSTATIAHTGHSCVGACRLTGSAVLEHAAEFQQRESGSAAVAEMKVYDFYTRWGHGEMKRFVEDYWRQRSTAQIPATPRVVSAKE